MAGLRFLLPMLHPRRSHRQRTVQGQSDWLRLLCRTLSFPIPSRFIPALSQTPPRGREAGRLPAKSNPSGFEAGLVT